jgi:hypothetical protein
MTTTTCAGAAAPVGALLDDTGGEVAGEEAAEVMGERAAIGPAAGVVDVTWLASWWPPAAPVGTAAAVHPARITPTTLARSAIRHAAP